MHHIYTLAFSSISKKDFTLQIGAKHVLWNTNAALNAYYVSINLAFYSILFVFNPINSFRVLIYFYKYNISHYILYIYYSINASFIFLKTVDLNHNLSKYSAEHVFFCYDYFYWYGCSFVFIRMKNKSERSHTVFIEP